MKKNILFIVILILLVSANVFTEENNQTKKYESSNVYEPGNEPGYDYSSNSFFDKSSSIIFKGGINYFTGGVGIFGGITYAKYYKKGSSVRPGFQISIHATACPFVDYYVVMSKLGFSTLFSIMINDYVFFGAGIYVDFQLSKSGTHSTNPGPYYESYKAEFNTMDFGGELVFGLLGRFLYGAIRVKIGFAKVYDIYDVSTGIENHIDKSKFFFIGGEGGFRF